MPPPPGGGKPSAAGIAPRIDRRAALRLVGAVIRILLALLLLALPARAEAPPPPAPLPLLDVAGVPGLGPNGQMELSRTLLRNLPRAFAIGPGGAYAARAGNAPPEEVERQALDTCRQHTPGRVACVLWLSGLDLVGPGRAWSAPRPPEGMAFGGAHRVTLPDPRFIWWGPLAARGVVLWAHGRSADGTDSRGTQPQPWLRHFNNAGYDIWRFDRDPTHDATAAAAGWMRADLGELRTRGYRRVLVAGQSRGGWNALMALDTPGLAEVHIAIAPAAIGELDEQGQQQQIARLRAVVAAARAGRARVAVANFAGDPFNGLPDARAEALRGLEGRVGALLLLDRPDGIAGHAAGHGRAFAERYGGCLFRFATLDPPPAAC